ncbi:FecR family protein [Labrys sp. WJW]|uniref:FecR family protein n=1 Tax=Labrys sp. WJW TaxID=1737983 RepID=UPI001FDA2491|nr:FecR domain-containing protein [Labrys sp. WJW]
MAMVAAAIAGIFLVAAMPTIMLRLEADYITATAESRNIRLRDGTLVMLGADSAISVNIGDSGLRKIRLLSGEAYFDVAHDASHPFVVDAGGVDVTVLGTAFDVRLSTMATTVQLARGSIDVSYKHPGVPGEARLMPGEMAVVDRATGQITRGTVAQKDIASWREGQLFVNDETIGSVVEQLQRYHSAWIKLPDGNLAARRVTGLYDLRDPDRALRALVQPYGGKVRELSPYVRVLSHY